MRLTLTPRKLPDTTGYNVVADLKGSEHPEQVVVVSGHLDSWDLGTGAIDDAAGVAVAMETAELVQRLHLRPKRTIRVIAWMDEESGGRGRDAYTAAHSAEFPKHVAAIESDLGAAHPMGFDVKMSAQGMDFLRPVQKEAGSVQSGSGHFRDVTGGGADARPDAGWAQLLQLPSHGSRHARQNCSGGVAGECGRHGSDGLRISLHRRTSSSLRNLPKRERYSREGSGLQATPVDAS